MRKSIREAIKQGLFSLAECGGFMYLHEKLTDKEGHSFPMAGAILAECHDTGKLVRFGYIELTGIGDAKIRAHEFHYYDSTDNGTDCTATKPVSGRSWKCIHMDENKVWGFPHLYYPSNPGFVEYLIERCRNPKED